MTDPIDDDQLQVWPPPTTVRPSSRRRVLLVAGLVVGLLGAAVGGYLLADQAGRSSPPTATPTTGQATAPRVLSTSPADLQARQACIAVFKVEILAPETQKTMTETDWWEWRQQVAFIADNAKSSTNREVARAAEDLVFYLGDGESLIPATVLRGAARLRDACDRVDYINIPSD